MRLLPFALGREVRDLEEGWERSRTRAMTVVEGRLR